MILDKNLIETFKEVSQHGDIEKIKVLLGLKSYAHTYLILKGTSGTTMENILIIKKFIDERLSILEQIKKATT